MAIIDRETGDLAQARYVENARPSGAPGRTGYTTRDAGGARCPTLPVAARRVRERVAAECGLPPGYALLPQERDQDARRARWAVLPAEERARRANALLSEGKPFLSRAGEVAPLGRLPAVPGDSHSPDRLISACRFATGAAP